jgi:membrane protease subunit (stomatin/prohibitin family)
MPTTKIVFQGKPEDVIWKSPITELGPNTKIYSHKDSIILFFRQGSLLGAFNDQSEYNIVNEDTSGFKSKKTIDHCAVYYINRTKHIQVKWGTPHRVEVHDKGFDMYTSIGAHGTYSFKVLNPLQLFTKMKIFEESLTKQMINQFFSEEISMYLRSAITTVFSESEKGLRDIALITSQEQALSRSIKEVLIPLFQSYGVSLQKFVIAKLDYDKAFIDKIKEIRSEAVLSDYSKENKLPQKEATKIRCDVCGTSNKKDNKFCKNCGSTLVTTITCESCDAKLPKDAKFCTNCGQKVGEE